MQTIKLTDIDKKWAQALESSAAINAFCMDKYSKLPTIYLGFDGKNMPKESDCPVIILAPGNKTEGLEQSNHTFYKFIRWSVANKSITKAGNIVSYDGEIESDELGQLIYMELAELNPDMPISQVDIDVNGTHFFPQFPGKMDIQLDLEVLIGAETDY